MTNVKEITDLMDSPSTEDIELINKAYSFAEKAHAGFKRNNGDPYFFHVFETAKNLATLKKGAVTVAAGLLHDSMEDAGITAEQIEKEFGKEILFLVEGVTKLGKLKYRGATRHSESLRKLFVAMSQDIRVIIIKLADRLHNMRTLEHVPKHKQLRIAEESLEIYAPIAYRLGIRKLNRELEDLSFSYVYPKEYTELKKLTAQRHKKDLQHLEKFNKSFKKALATADIIDIHTDFRIKGLYSLHKKLQRKENDIEKVYDISALRVIVPTVDDCYRVLGRIHSIWRPLPGRIKDYIAFPKPNGYRSIHTTIFTGDGGIIEIQIKTEEMHKEAEYGIASHLSYKDRSQKVMNQTLAWIKHLLPEEERKLNPDLNKFKDTPNWIKELAEYQEENNDQDDFIQNLKTDFFEERIFVFTPKGDVIDLPIDSTPVDFAYSIHSDIGNHMFGVKINGKFLSLDTKLRNGDIVEVQTKPGNHPSIKWLKFAKTTLAQKHIRIALQDNKKSIPKAGKFERKLEKKVQIKQ